MATLVRIHYPLSPNPQGVVLLSPASDNIPLQKVPHELTASEREAILTHVRALGRSGEEDMRSFSYDLPNRPTMFVKWCFDNLAEAATQNFFYRLSLKDESAPRIPQVFDAFSSETGDYVIVMEMLEGSTLADCGISEEEAVKHAAFAVGWLLKQSSSVPTTCFGRISSEKAAVWHQVFKDHQSPGPFANPSELAMYISKASQRSRAQAIKASPEDVLCSFGEARCIYHSDIKKENFLFLKSKKIGIVDFQHIGVLPEVFQTYAFFNTGERFATAVGKLLGHQPSSAADAMVPISTLLQQSGGTARFGMFND